MEYVDRSRRAIRAKRQVTNPDKIVKMQVAADAKIGRAPLAATLGSARFAVYRRPRLIAVLLMGFSSGLPLALTFGTLSYWLAEIGVSLTAIGLFGLVRLVLQPQIPVVAADRPDADPVSDRAARAAAQLGLGDPSRCWRWRSWRSALTDPRIDPAATALAAVVVAFLSASQDIVIDAYRIELLLPEEQGAGAAATQWGYRFGMLASGAGALYAASYGGWRFAYALMAALMLVGMATVWFTPEPGDARRDPIGRRHGELGSAARWSAPFIEWSGATGRRSSRRSLSLSCSTNSATRWPARCRTRFTSRSASPRSRWRQSAKSTAFIATLAGVAVGGILVLRLGVFRSLLVCGGMQALSNLMYAVQVWAGHDLAMLAVTIGAENLTGGMASSAFVAYLSGLCHRDFTATQYALLSSLATFGLNVLAASGGYFADRLGWVPFFVLSTLACVPALLLLLWLMRRAPAPA